MPRAENASALALITPCAECRLLFRLLHVGPLEMHLHVPNRHLEPVMRAVFVLSAAALLLTTPAIAANDAPVAVMIVGGFHMSGGHDMHNVVVDDVLAPKRQTEIQAVVDGVAKFKPTAVDVEWDEPYTAQKYADFLAGKL